MAFGPSIPLQYDMGDGFALLKEVESLIEQSIVMMTLTIPGERVMDPNYGVGLSQFLFENFTQATFSNIDAKIREQAGQYMPGVSIDRVTFAEDQDSNVLLLKVFYSIPSLGINSSATITQNAQNNSSY